MKKALVALAFVVTAGISFFAGAATFAIIDNKENRRRIERRKAWEKEQRRESRRRQRRERRREKRRDHRVDHGTAYLN